MILNAKNNNWRFELPRDFFKDHITERYLKIIKRLPCPYTNVRDWTNSLVQGISWNAVDLPVVTQENLHNPQTPHRGKGNLEFSFDKTIDVTFKLSEGYINYWLMFEHLSYFYDYTTKSEDRFFKKFVVSFLDNIGYELVAIELGRVVMTGLSNLDLSFTSNIPDFKTFDVSFQFTTFEPVFRLQ